jgi:hypothetical protein
MSALDWKSRSGRTTGPDHYQYGDVTRAIFTTKRSWGEKVLQLSAFLNV